MIQSSRVSRHLIEGWHVNLKGKLNSSFSSAFMIVQINIYGKLREFLYLLSILPWTSNKHIKIRTLITIDSLQKNRPKFFKHLCRQKQRQTIWETREINWNFLSIRILRYNDGESGNFFLRRSKKRPLEDKANWIWILGQSFTTLFFIFFKKAGNWG